MSDKRSDVVGIIGRGFVGNAVYEGLRHAFDVQCYDSRKELSTVTSIEKLCKLAETIFVCVPTPMLSSGQCDTSIVDSVIRQIREVGNRNTVVVKSTVELGTVELLDEKYADGQHISAVMFNPEFLTEANAIDDFKTQDRIIIGAPPRLFFDSSINSINVVESLYERAYPSVRRVVLQSTEAELVKYVTNSFLATKISLSNEYYQICQRLGVSYGNVIDAATLDKRLGNSFWKVPGPVLVDGKPAFGFGLSCFPKDVNSLIFKAKQLGVDPVMLEATWKKNLEVRPPEQRDWEKMEKATRK